MLAAFALLAAPAFAGPTATMYTTYGKIVIELDPEHAPKAVANFIRYVKVGYYNNIRIYRIEPDFLIQMGDLTDKDVIRTPPYKVIPAETATSMKHARGTVGLAHKAVDMNSGDSTFYIDLADNKHLNAKPGAPPNTTGDTVFGHVIEGMDVVDKIAHAPRLKKAADQWFPGATPKTPIIVKRVVMTGEAPVGDGASAAAASSAPAASSAAPAAAAPSTAPPASLSAAPAP